MRKLKPNEIECRVAQVTAKGCSLLLYKTARVDRAILDEEFGSMYWQNDFKVIDGKMYGSISVYNKELKEWVTKSDCGVESNTEAEKGQASDCFKRAGFKWGIGIELYSAPFIFILEPTEEKNGKYYLKDKYKKYIVKEITYNDDGNINHLIITDNKDKEIFKWNNKSTKEIEKEIKERNKEREKEKIPNDEMFIYYEVSECKTVEEIEDKYKLYKKQVTDIKALTEACKCRKETILKEVAK